jgi:hypothetical protein
MVIEDTISYCPEFEIKHYQGKTKFYSCKCRNTCDCRVTFKSEVVDYYTLTINNLTSKRGKSKTFHFDTLEEVISKLSKRNLYYKP